MKNSYARTIHFLCEDKTMTHPVVHNIEQNLQIEIPYIEPDDLMMALQRNKHKILMVDYRDYTRINNKIRQLPLTNKVFENIIINVESRLTTDEVLHFGHLKGLFYDHEPIDEISKGCSEIINGENWLPRKVAAQLLYHYRNIVEVQSTPATVDLTTREIHILRSLMTGASNSQIAEEQFISEFTVKSHLYQIFKKLCVKNRVQASAWARQNLLS
ncbi:LuxR family transcriptional regulator [Vibrio sinaloensis DSM 21326]|uniref:LuxR family transcriptional regulator n=1 Tax=Vibrio sinaloensis DSM 21326 TaxID=945550 RepID=E8M2F4_PHOS4|nr:LuxR C-terminal-related transcriptional regulator [Vibrio sinaloensis]EGA71781.1 LuxR family transcriptional regulator [Vibrio sinaloensis DSM 21326]